MKNEIFRTKEVNGLVNIVIKNVNHKYVKGGIKTVVTYDVFIGCDPVFGITQFRDLTKFWFTSKAEAMKYAKQTMPLESEYFPAKVAIVHNASKIQGSNIGIHLKDADQFSFQDAMDVAERDNFPAIYIHSYSKSKAV